MATIKINVMSIVAIILTIAGIIAVALYEVQAPKVGSYREPECDTYEAMVIIAIILAIVVLIVTCLDVESVTGKTFLIYGISAVLLLIGVIVFGYYLGNTRWVNSISGKTVDAPARYVASIVFACIAMVSAIAGAVAPFVCNK